MTLVWASNGLATATLATSAPPAAVPATVPAAPAAVPPAATPAPQPVEPAATPPATTPPATTPPAAPPTPPASPTPTAPAPQVTPEQEPVSLVLRLKKRRVYVYRGSQEVANYPVAIGRKGWETPTGKFTVIQKLRDPAWQHPWNGQIVPPGPDNPLGDRWIAFWTDGTNYIGFHGTPNEELVGQAVSHGCVRMKNRDIRAMFEKVQEGTPVRVEP